MLTADLPPGFPIRRADAQRRQLGGRACQAGPPPGFRASQLESTKASIESLLTREHVVDNGTELLGDERASDRFPLSPHETLILRLDFGEVLRGPDRGMWSTSLRERFPSRGRCTLPPTNVRTSMPSR